jgi:TIR domain
MARFFISYRREESSPWAGRLYDRLAHHFGREHVFMDIDTIEPGADFVEVIQRNIATCDALIALIGRQWLTITDSSGERRLDHPDDIVRMEIAAALKREIRVIPALIHGTPMPRSIDLPEEIRPLARRNSLEITDLHFHRDVDQLIAVLSREQRTTSPGTLHSELEGTAPSRKRGEERDTAMMPEPRPIPVKGQESDEQAPVASSKITLVGSKQAFLKMRPIRAFVDEREVGSFTLHSQVDIPLTPGLHKFYVTHGRPSNRETVYLTEGETQRFLISCSRMWGTLKIDPIPT